MDERERFEKGLEVRRNVLGDKHVNKSLEKNDSFTEEFQDLVTRAGTAAAYEEPDHAGDVDRVESRGRNPAASSRSPKQWRDA